MEGQRNKAYFKGITQNLARIAFIFETTIVANQKIYYLRKPTVGEVNR